MNKLWILLLLTTAMLTSCKDKSTYVKITTSMGDMVFRLYDETPQHRDNFIKMVEDNYFKDLLFHRVMNNFMIQGGDPNSRNAEPRVLLGDGGPDHRIPAEFMDSLFHRKGVLAAAREPDIANPQKESSASQFYIVDGKKYTEEKLVEVESRYNITIPEYQRLVYKELGGTPFLDQNYTVFGEMMLGFNVLEAIAAVQVDRNNRPLEDVVMNVEIVKWNARKSTAK